MSLRKIIPLNKTSAQNSESSESSSDLDDDIADRESALTRRIFSLDKNETEELSKKSYQRVSMGNYMVNKFN